MANLAGNLISWQDAGQDFSGNFCCSYRLAIDFAAGGKYGNFAGIDDKG
ncbi:MAG: hypothetical protein ABSD28_14455 [Tepidisphaeraceae bacterium]